MKKIFKFLGILLGIVLLAVLVLFGWLTLTEFKPEPVESVDASQTVGLPVCTGDSFPVLSMNVSYCALGPQSDFFMDGGLQVPVESTPVQEVEEKSENKLTNSVQQKVDEDSEESLIQISYIDLIHS